MITQSSGRIAHLFSPIVNQINGGKMKTQPAQPSSGRIAHLLSPTVNQINSGKMKTQPFSGGIAYPFSPYFFSVLKGSTVNRFISLAKLSIWQIFGLGEKLKFLFLLKL
ncbi:MAG: hypothetical protein LBL62_01150 [Planctomycetaceae bacterium]|jgi:hypothetical protein|nr:hypothetical protein [Planctomycetaceae bacterium]